MKRYILGFFTAAAAAAALWLLHRTFPCPLTALLTPVNGSLWEMGKLLFWPYLPAALGRWWEPLYLLAGAQGVLGCFNLLPILHLDGGRMLWLALCWGTDPFLADRVTQAVSLATAGY